jgi:dipeptidyl-peptidase-4
MLCAIIILAGITFTVAQDRLKEMPGYDQYTKMQPLISGSIVSGQLNITWTNDGKAFTYTHDGKAYQFDLSTMKATETGDAPAPAAGAGAGRGGRGAPPAARGQGQGQQTQDQTPPPGRGRGGMEQAQAELTSYAIPGCPQTAVARGRQADCVVSPDSKLKAFYLNRNLWVANFDGTEAKAITKDGSEKDRIKNGTGSWVYGEELSQTTAIWWSPDSKKVGFYRFDESQVKDFYLAMKTTQVEDALDVEAYPKAGAPNPVPELLIYDTTTGQTTKLDVRDGKPFENAVIGYYVYDIHWSSDGTELLFNRANRRQQIMELAAGSPATGKCRVIVHEEWLTGWLNTDTSTSPSMSPRWLKDGKRFIWPSERTGWINYYLYDISGKLIAPLTSNQFEAANIVKLDETAGVMFYMARDGDNYLKLQLHRVGLDGKGDVRLTNIAFNHSVGNCMSGRGGRGGGGGAGGAGGCGISPDNLYFADIYQSHDQPPATQLVNATTGKVLVQLAKSDMTKYEQTGFKKAEQFSYKAADGTTTLFGQISFPSNFDPSKKYPTLVPVYGGPVLVSSVPTEDFARPNANCEYGFLVVSVGYRGVPGLGKRAADALYMKLGVTEMDDMAEGIKALWDRPYFDKARVGIYGTSYGGYTAATEILRHPDVFTAASASSPPTSWYNYDSIYTERYMWIPQENKEGYEAGNDMNFAKDLRGRLLLYYGTADNNVHPNNSMQLIRALQQAGKSFEVQVGPDQPHSGVNNQRMMEFFIENLVMHPERLMAPQK